MGPGGNGKSFLSGAMEYILDLTTGKPSFKSRNFGPDTNKAEMVGPHSPKALMKREEYVRLETASLANYFGARIEEFFDAPPNVVRAVHEIYDQRDKRLRLLVATTNKTIDQLLVMSEDKYDDRDLLRPTLNRFPLKIVVPRDFARAVQYLHMFRGAGDQSESPLSAGLSWQALDVLSQASRRIVIPLHVQTFALAVSLQLRDAFLNQEVQQLEQYRRDKELKGKRGDPPFAPGTDISRGQ